ncbi:MAG: hypothetical protein LUH10_09915 [Tannerellaceae bacterium]|nr:hypothetical protein [Tannerellaceae bacterium]
MSTQDDLFQYDDDEAVKFIRNYLPQELKEKFNDDDIIYIVDLIHEFFENKGFFDASEDLEFDEDEMLAFVVKNAPKDEIGKFDPEEIRFVIQGELEYGNLFE